MRHVLFGDERYIKEVIYVCEDLLGQYETVLYSEAEKLEQIAFDSECKVLICAYDKEAAVRELQARQIAEEYYVFSEELFQRMDKKYLKVPEHRKLAIWGLGKTLKELGENVSDWAEVYIDKNPALVGTLFRGKPVYAPEEAVKKFREYFFFVTVGDGFRDEIRALLESNGYEETVDFSFGAIDADNYLPSSMMEKVLNAKSMKNWQCERGMVKVDIDPQGDINPCCSTWFPVVMGRLLRPTSVSEEWDSYKARIAKLSMVNRTNAFCTMGCPLFYKAAMEAEYYPREYAGFEYENKGPKHIMNPKFGFDQTCNLRCESCRENYITTYRCETKNFSKILHKIKEEILPYAEEPLYAGNGEVFYSKIYRDLWVNTTGKKRKNIYVYTNGMLFNEKNWELLEQGYEQIKLHVSIDAASKKIYEEVRRGGKWEILVRNMEFAARLRKENRLKAFSISFVIQQKNYQECKEFIKLGKAWNVDSVGFTPILNWGTYSEEEFKRAITLWDDGELPVLRPEYREFFSDRIFDDPIVGEMGAIRNCGS